MKTLTKGRAPAGPFAPRAYGELQSVTPSVYIYRNITNSSFVIGDEGVAVIDTQVNRPSAERVLEAIRSVTDKPILFAINTHYHWDHTNGNELFKREGAAVVASKLTKEFMVTRHDRQKEFLAGRGFQLGKDPLLPEITFEGEYCLDLGNQPLRLFFAGRAETDDATAVHVQREHVLMSGDTIMTGSFPIFGQPVWDEGLQGDGEWQSAIRNLIALKPSSIIPGHGPLAHEAEVALLLRIEEYFTDEVRTLLNRGCDLDEILRDLEPRLPDWITRIPVVWGTPRYAILRVYRGLTRSNGGEPGFQAFKPSAIPTVGSLRLEKLTAGKEGVREFLRMAEEAGEGGDSALRVAILKKGAQSHPDASEILNAYADALVEGSRGQASVLEKGDFFQIARDCWDRVLARDPRNTAALVGKGRFLTMLAYRGGDDPMEGMALLNSVLELKPGGRLEAEARFYVGMGYRRLGEEDKARLCIEKALETDPTFMPARMA